MSRVPSGSSRPASATRQEAQYFLIVTEGEETEPEYFKKLKDLLGLARRVEISPKQTHAQVAPAPDHTGSSPDQVLACALNLKKQGLKGPNGKMLSYDQVWLVIDTEAPGTSHRTHLPGVIRQAGEKKLKIALSRPCFEAWIHLHLSDSLRSNLNSKTAMRAELRRVLPAGISPDLDAEAMKKLIMQILPHTDKAVERARRRDAQIDLDPQGLPRSATSQIYRLVEDLIQSSPPSARRPS